LGRKPVRKNSRPHPSTADDTIINPASIFQDNSSGTIAHDLLCIGNPDAWKWWFMTAAGAWTEVTHHLRASDGTNIMKTGYVSPQELAEVPFDIYVYKQRKGDLVILPPRR
jgi:hypothetical protein